MNFLRTIKSLLNPPKPSLQQLASGLCAVPLPIQRQQAPKAAKAQDSYIENKETNTFGFNFATAAKQSEGSVPNITDFDLQLLKEREYWGKTKSVQAKNVKCKKLWSEGKGERDAAVALGMSESWVEKRFGTFYTALQQETAETISI